MKTEIHIGDCLEVLRTLPAGSVQTCITSPRYWGLRDYGTASWVGGDPGCDHEASGTNRGKRGELPEPPGSWSERAQGKPGWDCPKCGAKRSDSQIGLEKTPEDHIAVMVEVFREVRRVLRDDGTLWMNYGDAYMDKQLIGMPWRVALALQADGWWLRSSIIWAKGVSFCDSYSGGVMPESCRDRPTRAHENLFLLSQAPRYFYDADAVREKHADFRTGKNSVTGETKAARDQFAAEGGGVKQWNPEEYNYNPLGRNLRDVWTINTRGFKGAHFATFPPALVEPCIKAGTSEKGCCASCGAPIRRIVEATGGTIGEAWHDHSDDLGLGQQKDADGMESYSRETTGWEPTCTCEDAGEPVPCKVLDPFGGAGTAALVADRLGRDAVLVELNKEYAEMARDRILADCPMFSSVELVGGCKEKTPRNK